MTDERANPLVGRPAGSGAVHIRALWPDAQQSGRIFIGRRLWQDLGRPERVDVLLVGGGDIVIAAREDGHYTVVGESVNGMPRISVGRSLLERLALREGRYATTIVGTEVRLGHYLGEDTEIEEETRK